MDQTGIDCEALTTNQAFLHATRNRRLEHMAQQIAFAEAAMTVFGKARVIRNAVRQIEAAKPAESKVQMHLLAKPPLRSNAETISDQKHADQQLWVNGGAARMAVEIRQMRADAGQINKPINRPHQVIMRNVIL